LIRYRPQTLPDLNGNPRARRAIYLHFMSGKSGKAGKHVERFGGLLVKARIVGERLKLGESPLEVARFIGPEGLRAGGFRPLQTGTSLFQAGMFTHSVFRCTRLSSPARTRPGPIS